MMRPVALALCVLVLGLGGCRTAKPTYKPSADDAKRSAAAAAAIARVTVEEASTYYRNKTIKTYDTSHGTQVEYHGADGRCYLWYPGNTAINRCRWKIEKRLDPRPRPGDKPLPNICYSYGENSYNPATGHRGSGWQCKRALVPFTDQDGSISFIIPPPSTNLKDVQIVTGDKFNLARRVAVPFGLQKKRYSFAELEAQYRSQ